MKNKLLYKENFTKDGYVIIKNFLKKSEINKLKKDLINGYKKHLNKNITQRSIHHIIAKYEKDRRWNELYYAFKKYNKSGIFKEISKRLSKLAPILIEKKKKTKLINAGLNIGIKDSKRTAYRWHQEKPYYKNISTIHFQFPILNAFSKKNGTMSVLSGSHKLGFIKKTITSQQHKKSVYSYIPKDIRKIEKKFVEKSIIIKLKDIVVFDENVLHRSNKNLTNKIRFAGTVRYQIIN